MPITTSMTWSIKRVAVSAIAPVGASVRCALLRPNPVGAYDATYAGAYVPGMGGDEVTTGFGYVQGGVELAGRQAGDRGTVRYDDARWEARGGSIRAGGAVIYDASHGNRILGFVDFGAGDAGVEALEDTFTVKMPAEGLVQLF